MNLYNDTIEDHFRHPRNFAALQAPSIREEGFNPFCGDRIRIELTVSGDNVTAAGFQGDLCAIAKASASLLTEMVRGLPVERVQALGEEEVFRALGAEIQPARRKCATLPLEVMQSAIKSWRSR